MTTHFINDTWLTGSGEEFTSLNPATGETIWRGKAAGAKEVDAAYAAARAAFADWGFRSVEDRIAIVRAFAKKLEEKKASAIETLCRETGKAKWDATNEINATIAKAEVAIKSYHERTGTKEGEFTGVHYALRHKPHGVVAVFGPYNFPAHLPNGHITPALIAGNTIVFKPSEYTPLMSEVIVKIWQEAGLPAGVLNLLQGERETGKLVSAHAQLDGLFFTGSSATGTLIHQQFAGSPEKILALEMGGNNPLVIWKVADKKAAAYHAIQSAFMTTGQRCTCSRRIFIEEGREGDAFVEAFVAMSRTIKAGTYDAEPSPYMGPVIGVREAVKIVAAQEKLIAMGAKPLLALKQPDAKLPFLSPGILDATAIRDSMPDGEVFGPLTQIVRVKSLDEATAYANRTRFGLSSAIFTDERAHFDAFLKTVRAGIVNWNRPTTGNTGILPFGGFGISGNQRPSGFYAADYCAWPVASNLNDKLEMPASITPGMSA